jgi:hypothetical protein
MKLLAFAELSEARLQGFAEGAWLHLNQAIRRFAILFRLQLNRN